jgi:rhodanese-related sulfurtransferase
MGQLLIYVIPILVGVTLGLTLVIVRDWIKTPVSGVDLDTFMGAIRKGQLIDIRSQKEFQTDAIKGARHFTVRFLVSKNQTKVRKDLPVYLYHTKPFKAKRSAKKMVIRGYKNVTFLNQTYPLKNGPQ